MSVLRGTLTSDLSALYALTDAATEESNTLDEEFIEAGSELETEARERIGDDFWFIATTDGVSDALIANRDR